MFDIIHITESFSTGVYSWLKQTCNPPLPFPKTQIIFSQRPDHPSHKKVDFPNTQLTKINMYREISIYKDIKAAITITKTINNGRPKLIHCHSSKAGFITRILTPFLKGKPTIVYSPHGISFIRKDIKKSTKAFYILLENLASLFSKKVLCCSKSEYETYKKYVPFSHCNYINNCCDLSAFNPYYHQRLERITSSKGKKIHVITVGGVAPSKNPEQFIQIFRALRLLNISFTWVGGGNQQDIQLLKSAGITVTGWASPKEVKHYLSLADIYLQTSRWEGMPIAVIEAMATGLPCIVSNIPGNTDCIVQNKNGYIYDNTIDAVNYINSFNDQDKLLQFSKNSRTIAEKNYSLDTFHSKLHQFYNSQST